MLRSAARLRRNLRGVGGKVLRRDGRGSGGMFYCLGASCGRRWRRSVGIVEFVGVILVVTIKNFTLLYITYFYVLKCFSVRCSGVARRSSVGCIRTCANLRVSSCRFREQSVGKTP